MIWADVHDFYMFIHAQAMALGTQKAVVSFAIR